MLSPALFNINIDLLVFSHLYILGTHSHSVPTRDYLVLLFKSAAIFYLLILYLEGFKNQF